MIAALVSGQAVGGTPILAGLLLLTRDGQRDPSRQPPHGIPAADTVTTTR